MFVRAMSIVVKYKTRHKSYIASPIHVTRRSLLPHPPLLLAVVSFDEAISQGAKSRKTTALTSVRRRTK